jgi:hypothetical protein
MSASDLIQYQDWNRVLVVKGSGDIVQLFVPFRVVCIHPLNRIPINTRVYVNGVFLHPKFRLVYWINQRLYPYHYFQIQIMF